MSMTHNEIIAVIAAHRDGKQIERKWARGGMAIQDEWSAQASLFFNFGDFEYRIKPEPPKPREWWIRTTRQSWEDRFVFDSPPIAEKEQEFVHVREVLPDKEGKA